MLKKRVIPKLLVTEKSIGDEKFHILVTTKEFSKKISIGDPVSQAKIYEANFADELLVLCIDNKPLKENPGFVSLVKKLSKNVFMPLCIGGGVKNVDDFDLLLAAGSDKVSINSLLMKDQSIVKEASKNFGSQCVVASVDFIKVDNKYKVFDRNTLSISEFELIDFCKNLQDIGVGEIHICDMGRDGSSFGLDIKAFSKLADNLEIPLIISGGIGMAQDIVEGFISCKVDAIAIGTYFCLRDQNPMQTRAHVKNAGIPIRI